MPSGVYPRKPRKQYDLARMASQYDLAYCRERLEADPLGCTRLFLISQGGKLESTERPAVRVAIRRFKAKAVGA